METSKDITLFKSTIWRYYKKHKRHFLWRETTDPYNILISEVMLQQTQVSRVEEKYPEFLKAFPNITSLAKAPLCKVLSVWQGMGYNRRALSLQKMAQKVVQKHNKEIPQNTEELLALPGVGQSTAGAVMAYAYNKPSVFIETNIRRVFIHFFFQKKEGVDDRELLPLIENTLSYKNPRGWYSALMDYGTKLAQEGGTNPNRKSKHYTKQSTFKGSKREVRGTILKTLIAQGSCTEDVFFGVIKKPKKEVREILNTLMKEGFVKKERRSYMLI